MARKATPKKKKAAPKIVRVGSSQSLGRVGIIAVVGFAVGVVWPRLAGISLVPEAPIEEEAEARAAELAEQQAPREVPAQEPDVREIKPEDRLMVEEPQITSCRDHDGKKTTSCGELNVDELVHSTIMGLLECPAAEGVFGTLSLGFDMNFEEGKVEDVRSGQSTSLPETVTEELLRCAEKDLSLVSLSSDQAPFADYTVFYVLEFKPPEVAAEQESQVTPASGKATVQWQTALVRKDAARDADVMARMLSGARLVVTGRKGDWYRVKYDAKGREGWVHGAALGLK